MPRVVFAVYPANLAYGRAYKPLLEPLGLKATKGR